MPLFSLRTGLLAMVAALLLWGCSSPATKANARLDHDLHEYCLMLRWKDWHGIGKLLPPEYGDAFVKRMKEVSDQLNMADVRLEQVRGNEKGEQISQITVEYFLMPSPRLLKTELEQTWKTSGGVWMLTEDFPANFP